MYYMSMCNNGAPCEEKFAVDYVSCLQKNQPVQPNRYVTGHGVLREILFLFATSTLLYVEPDTQAVIGEYSWPLLCQDHLIYM